MRRHLIFSLSILVPVLTIGETVYKYTDSDGQVYFTDKPPEVAGSVEIIQHDPYRIHQRLDKEGTPLFENFSRSQVNPLTGNRVSATGQISGADRSAEGTKQIWTDPLEFIKQPLATLIRSFIPLFGLLLIGIGLPLVLRVVLTRLKGREGEERVAKLLDGQSYEVLHDAIVEDKAGEPTQIDHLLKLNSGLLVIETKNYSGMIFGSEKEPMWTQRIGRRSYRFQNPLRQNDKHIQTLRQYLPDLPIHGRVVFVGDAEFPKGRLADVLNLKDLILEVDSLQLMKTNPQSLESAWRKIEALTKSDASTRRKHLKRLQKRYGRRSQMAIGLSFIVLGLLALLFL